MARWYHYQLNWVNNMTNEGIKLVQTCGACPEQYDAYLDNKMIGYLRLRHGNFTVRYPDHNGEIVFEAKPHGDGLFHYEERDLYLDLAKKFLLMKHNEVTKIQHNQK